MFKLGKCDLTRCVQSYVNTSYATYDLQKLGDLFVGFVQLQLGAIQMCTNVADVVDELFHCLIGECVGRQL